MKLFRHLAIIPLLFSALCGHGQDFEPKLLASFTGQGIFAIPVMVGGTPVAVIGGARELRIGTPDTQFNLDLGLGQSETIRPIFAQRVFPNSFVVAGVIQGTRQRLFTCNVNLSTRQLAWSQSEPLRNVDTFPLQLIDAGICFVLASAVEGGVEAVGFDATTGTRRFQTSIATSDRTAGIARDGQENIYLVTNRDTANGRRVFVRSVTDTGFLRWEREYPFGGTGIQAFDFSIPLLFLATDTTRNQIHILEADLADGELLRSKTVALSASSSTPVAIRDQGRLLMHYLEANTRRRVELDLASFTTTVLNLGINSIDISVAVLKGVPIFSARNVGNNNLDLFPERTWNASSFPISSSPVFQSILVADNANDRLIVTPVLLDARTPVILEVRPRPVAQDDSIEAFFNELQITFDPTDNDIAATSADLEILSQPAGGTVSQNNDGTLTFTATSAKHQTETFLYRLSRGNLSSIGTVKIFRQPIGVGIDLSASRVKGGTAVTGKVRMSGPRQGAPQSLELFENSSATALASPTVQLLPGKTESEEFTVFTARVRNPVRAVITADEGNFSVEELAFLDIDPPFLTSLEAINTTVVGGAPAQFRMVLDAPAPSNGMPISVVDNSPAILVPATAVVPAGQTAGTFNAPTASVTSSRTAVVTASSNGITRSATVAIVGVTMAIDPLSVVGGQPSTGTITLTSNAINNSVVFDVTDNSPATAPQTPAIVPSGFRVGTFNIVTAPVTSTRSSTINAANGGVLRSVTMTVRVAALQSIIVSPNQVQGGSPYAGLVTLDGKAAGNGLTVGLTAANAIVQLPATLTIGAGNSQGLFVGGTTRPTQTLMIVITASLNGITRATTLVVTP